MLRWCLATIYPCPCLCLSGCAVPCPVVLCRAVFSAVDSTEFVDALRSRGYRRLLVQKGNGPYRPHVTVPEGEAKGQLDGVAIE